MLENPEKCQKNPKKNSEKIPTGLESAQNVK